MIFNNKHFSAQLAEAAAILLILLSVTRALFVILHDPAAGYANNYDMIRVSSCFGYWPVYTDKEKTRNNPAAPVQYYQKGETKPQACHWGPEPLLAFLAFEAQDIFSDDGLLDLRSVGMAKTILMAILLITIHRALRKNMSLALAHGFIAVLCLADPLNTLYFNGLYSEFFALVGIWLITWSLAGLAISPTSILSPLLLLFGGLILVTSRTQHLIIVILLIPFIFVTLGNIGRRKKIILFAGVVLIGIIGYILLNQKTSTSIEQVNRHDMLFGTWLPAQHDPLSSLEQLGLNEPGCKDLLNTNAYVNRGLNGKELCPQAFELSLTKIGYQILTSPAALITAVARGLRLSWNWRPSYLGEIAGAEFMQLPHSAKHWSFSWITNYINWSSGVIYWLTPIVFTILTLIVGRSSFQDSKEKVTLHTILTVLLPWAVLIITITWATSIFGDGYIELSRHLHLAIVYSAITWLLIWFVVVLRLKSASMLILSGAITYGVAHAMYRLPVGTFLLLQVDKNSEFMLLDGQAMDNVAITRIDFESKDGNRITAQIADAPGLSKRYPLVDGGSVRFNAEVPKDWAEDYAPVTLSITNEDNIRTNLLLFLPEARE